MANVYPRISRLSSDRAPFERHHAARFDATLSYRARGELPYDLAAVAAGSVLMPDTTVYIDAQSGKLPDALGARLAGAEILHCAVALGEITAGLGLLDPSHPGTPAISRVLLETLRRIDPSRTVAPSTDAWMEASVMAGVLARTQHLPKDARRKLLNDALLFLTAAEADAVLVSRNSKDMDLLLQLRPDVRIHLYDQSAISPSPRRDVQRFR